MNRLLLLVLGVLLVAAAFVAGRLTVMPAEAIVRSSRGPSPVVATVGELKISAADLQAEVSGAAPYRKQMLSSDKGRQEFLDEVTRQALFVEEAIARKMHLDPSFGDEARRLLAARLAEAELGDAKLRAEATTDELKRFYDEQRADYTRPMRIRASIILLSAEASDSGKWAARRREMEAVLEDVTSKLKSDAFAFATIASMRSDDRATKALGGDMQFLTRDEMAARWGGEVADAAFGLKQIGDLSGIIETPNGFSLLKLENVEPAIELPFEDAREGILTRVVAAKRAEHTEKLVDELRKEHGVDVDEAAISLLNPGAKR